MGIICDFVMSYSDMFIMMLKSFVFHSVCMYECCVLYNVRCIIKVQHARFASALLLARLFVVLCSFWYFRVCVWQNKYFLLILSCTESGWDPAEIGDLLEDRFYNMTFKVMYRRSVKLTVTVNIWTGNTSMLYDGVMYLIYIQLWCRR